MTYPKFATISGWTDLSGMSRTVTYEWIAQGKLKAIKLGSRTLIDCEQGLAVLAELPAAGIRPHGRRRPTGPSTGASQ